MLPEVKSMVRYTTTALTPIKNLLDDYIIPTNSRVNIMSSLFVCESEGTWRIFQIRTLTWILISLSLIYF